MERFDDITPIEEPVSIGGKEYVLREISGDAAVRYDDARVACHRYEDGKLVRLDGLAGLEPLLVSLCLFTKEGEPVLQETIRKWPARIQGALYRKAREVSGMNDTPEKLEKEIELLQRQLSEARKRDGLPKN